MKKIMIMFLFLLSSIYSFATINDNLNLLKDEEKSEINEKIEEIQKKYDEKREYITPGWLFEMGEMMKIWN